MLLTTGIPVMATGGFGAPCINNCILLLQQYILETNLILRNVGSVRFGDRLKKDDPICLKKTSIFKLQ